MSQDYSNTNSRKRRRAARASRPILVNTTGAAEQAQETTTSAVATSAPVAEVVTPVADAPAPKPKVSRMPRLPNFFSTVGKSEQAKWLEQEPKTKESEVAQARIARATRTSKVTPATKTPTVKTEKAIAAQKPAEEKPTRPASSSSRPAPARPTSTFKTRYIFGMIIYLIVAQVIGAFITGLFQKYRIDTVLTQFSLFGGTAVIRTSTIIYLAFLIIVLVLLARFDLLPRNLNAALNPSASNQARSSSSSTDNTSKGEQPQVKQGVSGADDALYQQYRARQRREKKK